MCYNRRISRGTARTKSCLSDTLRLTHTLPDDVSTAESVAVVGRRFLLIAPTFPPSSEVGALRWEKMLPFLANRGWFADVITLPSTQMLMPDARRVEKLPPQTRIFVVAERDPTWAIVLRTIKSGFRSIQRGVSTLKDRERAALKGPIAKDPYAGVSLTSEECLAIVRPSLRVRMNVRLMQARANLWADDVLALVNGASELQTVAVVTSGPPHNVHIAGRRLAATTDFPLLLDLRDPWAHNPSHGASVGCASYIRWLQIEEGLAFAQARWIVGNTSLSTDRYGLDHPRHTKRVRTVWNGADSDPMPQVHRESHPFRIAYAGAIYAGRTPASVFSALAALVRRLNLSPDDIRFDLMGDVQTVGAMSTMNLARDAGLEAFVHLHAAGTRDEARGFLATAHLLVSLPWPGREQVPAKIYEYADFPAWLLVLAHADTAPAVRLRGTTAFVVDPENISEIEAALANVYALHLANTVPRPVNFDGSLSREREANAFADLLDQAALHTSGAT